MNLFKVRGQIHCTTKEKNEKKVFFLKSKNRFRKAVLCHTILLRPSQAQKKATAEAVTPSKQPRAADVLTSTQLAQDPVWALERSLTDSPCSVVRSPLSEMSRFKLSNLGKAVLEERRGNSMLLKCLEEVCDTLRTSTPIYTDPTIVHVTLNHAFCRCRNKLTKDHQRMGLDVRVTGNQPASQQPFDVPVTEEQMKNPPVNLDASNSAAEIFGIHLEATGNCCASY